MSDPDPHDVRVCLLEILQRDLVIAGQVVGERTEGLELAAGLEFHDAALIALLEGRVERQPRVEVPMVNLVTTTRLSSGSPPRIFSYVCGLVCMSPMSPTPTDHVRK